MKLEQTVALARALLERGGTLESGAGAGPIEDDLLVAAITARMTAAGDVGETRPDQATAAVTAAGIANRARTTLAHLAGGSAQGALSEADLAGLEAIVMLTGRPPLRYLDGKVEMPPDVGENQIWRVLIAEERDRIEGRSASVGLIALEPAGAPLEPLGTGWRLGSNLVVTNRHVVRLLADHPDRPVKSWTLNRALTSSVDFWAVTTPSRKRRHQLTGIVWCSDTEFPDLAVLELDPGAEAPPGPLPLDWSEAALGDTIVRTGTRTFRGRQVYVVGHPYRTSSSGAVTQVFYKADGRKRCSPGYVTGLRGAKGIFEHDCSTLGGNSGSCVLSVDQHAVVGVHFAGLNVADDGVGSSNAAIAVARLAGSEAGTVLTRGRV
jgi:hypothetical protein